MGEHQTVECYSLECFGVGGASKNCRERSRSLQISLPDNDLQYLSVVAIR
ncbi:MAG: hypothetical protein ACM37W_16400 [Actinomycetota bacterium]